MGLRIATNVQSLQAQNNLKATTKLLNQSLTRLSTGLRVNSGSDDVVGLAKSEALRAKIRGIDVALNNISNAQSFLGVGEGYLAQLTDISQQLRETAVQASDGTISTSDRTSLTDKFTSLINEYNRLANNANFNSVRLLDGTFVNKTLQVGADEGETISISVSDARSSTIGKVAILTASTRTFVSTNSTAVSVFVDAGSLSVTVGANTYSVLSSYFTDDGVSTVDKSESAIAYVNAINTVSGQTGVTATILSNVVTLNYNIGSSIGDGLESNIHMIINGVTVKNTSLVVSFGDDTDASTLVGLINDNASTTGVTATIDSTNDRIVLTATDGRNIHVRFSDRSYAGNQNSGYNVFGAVSPSALNSTVQQVNFRGTYKITSDTAFSLSDTASVVFNATSIAVAIDTNTALSKASLTTVANAQSAISTMDYVIRQLQTRRGTIGSTTNRLSIAAAELQSRQENLSSAQSQIRDADIAVETAKLTQAQILQSAGVTVLAQANAAPQIALQLLQNL